MTPEGESLFVAAAATLNIDVVPHLAAFSALQMALLAGNTQMNLTSLTAERDILLKHFVDSLTCLRGSWLDNAPQILDLGTGAGFPALPLAILKPEVQFLAVDATRKKIEFVIHTAEALGLENVEGLVGRAETLGQLPDHRERHLRMVIRAVAALPVLAELGLPLLQEGGVLVAQKRQLAEEELNAGRRAAALLGGEVFHVERFTLPMLGDPRSLVIMRKIGRTPSEYPRRPGVPSKKPLGTSRTGDAG